MIETDHNELDKEVTPALEPATGQTEDIETDAVPPMHHIPGRDRLTNRLRQS